MCFVWGKKSSKVKITSALSCNESVRQGLLCLGPLGSREFISDTAQERKCERRPKGAEESRGDVGGEKPLLTPGLYDNLICVWWLRVWKALCPIRSMQQISTCPWQRWSGSFRRRCGTEPAKRAQILQVEQAEINEHHKPHLFNTGWHRMNIPSVKLFHSVFQLLKQMYNLNNCWMHLQREKKLTCPR